MLILTNNVVVWTVYDVTMTYFILQSLPIFMLRRKTTRRPIRLEYEVWKRN